MNALNPNVSEQHPVNTSDSPDGTNGVWRRKTIHVLAGCFGALLLVGLLSVTPLEDTKVALMRPAWQTWAWTVGGLLLSYALRAARLQLVLNLEGHSRAPHKWLGVRTDALRVILMHNAAINLLPMRAGELSFPWLASRELGMPMPRAVACLMWMRLQDLVVLAALGVLIWPALAPWVRVAGLVSLFVGWWAGMTLMRQWFTRQASATSPHETGISATLTKLRHALMEAEHHHPLAWLATLANWGVKLAAGACLLSAVSTAPWQTAWVGALGGELAAIAPLQGPAGFGTYEAGVWAGMATQLPIGSHALAVAISAALALHACFLGCALVAGALAAMLSWVNGPNARQGPPPSRHPG